MAQTRHINILVHGPKDADQLNDLAALPSEARIVAVGTVDELLVVGPEKLSTVNVLLNFSFGTTCAPKKELKMLWRYTPKLQWVHTLSTGVGQIIWEGLAKSSVVLTNSKGTYSNMLAEYAMAACLFFAKRIRTLEEQQVGRRWNQLHVEELRGRKLGIIGYGNIGQASARLGQAFGMEIAALRRRTELSQAEKAQNLQVYAPEQVSELTSSCDYIITALPATPATEKFVSAEAISAMQPHAVFINLGRGSTVDEAALTAALKAEKIRGAALDVFAEEPLAKSSPLWGLSNVLVSPHCAMATPTYLNEAVQQFVDLAKDYVQGKPLRNVCDKSAGY